MIIITVIYDTAARCPIFRTVKKIIYYGLNFEKKKIFCLSGTLIKQKPCTKKINMFKNNCGLYRGLISLFLSDMQKLKNVYVFFLLSKPVTCNLYYCICNLLLYLLSTVI